MSEVTREEFDKLASQVEENTKRLSAGDSTLNLITYRLDEIDKKLGKMDDALVSLQQKPAKKWETISSSVLQWVVAALLAYIAVRVGLA